MRKTISILLIVTLVLLATLSLPEVVQAQEEIDYVMVGVAAAVAGVVALGVRYLIRTSRARGHYERGDSYAAQGQWYLAADEYAKAAQFRSNYRDVQSKLAHARDMASRMLMERGDQAREREQYEEAQEFYRRALYYRPDSIQIRSRLDEISREMVSIFYRRGVTYESQNRWDEAYQEYQKAYFVNPSYQDLEDRYQKARSVVEGEKDLCAILFFMNKTPHALENPLILALQRELMGAAHDIYLLDYIRIQGIITEQAEALGDVYDDRLAMDLGRLLGVSRVITGTIESISTTRGRITMEVTARLLAVPTGQVVEETRISHRFPSGVEIHHLPHELEDLAKDLAQDLIP